MVLLGVFAVTAAQSAGRPFLFDEANFLFQARAIAETGIPYANMGYMGDRGRVTTREQYGLWHPPLYVYLLGLNVKLFGGAEVAARGMGIAIMLATALVTYAMARTLVAGHRPPPAAAGAGSTNWRGHDGPARAGGLLAVALLLVSPLVVQSAVVVDIDGTLLVLAVAGWSLLYLRWQDTMRPHQLALLGCLLALALWAKTTTPLALVGAVVGYQLLGGHWRRAFWQAAVILAVGLPLLLASWWLVARGTGMPFEMPFQWTTWELFDASRNTRDWLGDVERMRSELAPPLAWTSPYLVGAFGALALVRAAAWVRTRRVEPIDFLLIAGGVIFIAYFIKLAANFPKYHVAMLPFWSAALAWWLVAWWGEARWPARTLVAVSGILAGAIHALWVGDTWQWAPTLVWEPLPLGLALGLFVGALATVLLRGRSAPGACALARPTAGPAGGTLPSFGPIAPLLPVSAPVSRGGAGAAAPPAAAPTNALLTAHSGLAAVLIALYVGWALGVNAAQARADYSTNYYYGLRGQREAAAALDALAYDGPWIGAKEVAWYARNQLYIDADTFWWLVIAQGFEFDGRALDYDVRVVVPWTTDAHVRYFFEERLGSRYVKAAEVADYTIWVQRDVPLTIALAAPDAPHARGRPASRE